jgi:hypothetical protein
LGHDLSDLEIFKLHLDKTNKFLSYLTTPFKDGETLYQALVSEHTWKRPSAKAPFELVSVTAELEDPVDEQRLSFSSPENTCLKSWFQALGNLAQETPSLTQLQFPFDCIPDALFILPRTSIQKFVFDNNSVEADSMLCAILPKSPRLTDLEIATPASFSSFLRLLPTSNLTSLSLSIGNDLDFKTFGEVLGETKLKSLTIRYVPHFIRGRLQAPPDSINIFLSALSKIRSSLTFLNLSKLPSRSFGTLAETLPRLTNLRRFSLMLRYSGPEDLALSIVLPALHKIPALQRFDLELGDDEHPFEPSAAMHALSAFLPAFSSLRWMLLCLQSSSPSSNPDSTWSSLFDSLPRSLINLQLELLNQLKSSTLKELMTKSTASESLSLLSICEPSNVYVYASEKKTVS